MPLDDLGFVVLNHQHDDGIVEELTHMWRLMVHIASQSCEIGWALAEFILGLLISRTQCHRDLHRDGEGPEVVRKCL